MLASVIASGLTGKEFKPEDFMPLKGQAKEQTPDEMAALLKVMNMLTGEVKNG